MNNLISKFEPHAYTILRIVAGFLFLWHGSQKLFDFPQAMHQMPFFLKYIGGSVEFFGGLFIMLGLFTRWAAFLSCGQMAVAYWMVHASNSMLPLLNGGELAFLYCFLFLFIFAKGSGKFSLDRLLGI